MPVGRHPSIRAEDTIFYVQESMSYVLNCWSTISSPNTLLLSHWSYETVCCAFALESTGQLWGAVIRLVVVAGGWGLLRWKAQDLSFPMTLICVGSPYNPHPQNCAGPDFEPQILRRFTLWRIWLNKFTISRPFVKITRFRECKVDRESRRKLSRMLKTCEVLLRNQVYPG